MRCFARGCSLSCARFSSFCSHFSLRSSQWQRAFTAQLTYAACLHPAGVSHPDERISPFAALFGFHGRSNIYYFISFDSSSTVLGYLRSGLVSEVSGKKKNQGHLRWNLPPLELVTDPPTPTPPPPSSIRFPLFVVDVQVRFTILSDTFYTWWNHHIQTPSSFFLFSLLDVRREKTAQSINMRVEHIKLLLFVPFSPVYMDQYRNQFTRNVLNLVFCSPQKPDFPFSHSL